MAYVSGGNLAGTEPQLGEITKEAETSDDFFQSPSFHVGNHKPTLGEYEYYANLKREAERNGSSGNGTDVNGNDVGRPSIRGLIKHRGRIPKPDTKAFNEKGNDGAEVTVKEVHRVETEGLTELEIEMVNARRALRTASWGIVFYLITTDVLGPFNAPFAVANLGLVPGVLLYFFFGLIAFATGCVLSYLYGKLDSDRYPVRTFGDLAERLSGPLLRHFCSILQSIQLVVNVGIICLSNGQSLYQVSKGKLCFSVCVLVWALVGMIGGQIRSLQNFGIIGSASVYINLLIIFISMGVVAHSLPNYAVANAANDTLGVGPVIVKAFNSQDLTGQVNGMFNMVFAYGGAFLFPELMAEMRRPMDFYKGMASAQLLIFTAYMTYGVFWYCFQGQYTQAQSFQGLSPFTWQTICNSLNMVTSIVAAILYGNIGIKVMYINIVEDIMKGPLLSTKKGRILWTIIVPVYWALAFIIGSAVPALGAMTGLIGAVCIFQFTYTLPPIMYFLYAVQHDAAIEDQNFNGFGTEVVRKDTWRDASRWKRGILTGHWHLKIFSFFIFLAALACAGLGSWGTGKAVKEAFDVGQGTSFGCLANA